MSPELSLLERVQQENPDRQLLAVHHADFAPYGRVLGGLSAAEALASAQQMITFPEQGVQYLRSVAELERLPLRGELESQVFGGMPIQLGWCIGTNQVLNALEFHKSSEVIIAGSPVVLVLGHRHDIRDNRYALEQAACFYLPAGTAVELYAECLHFAPIGAAAGPFLTLIALPAGTNAPLEGQSTPPLPAGDQGAGASDEQQLLWQCNKWLLAQPGSPQAEQGAHVGLTGSQVRIQPVGSL
ncbi:DUF4867 family protein [Spirochaeta africana]|uniref:DUF4867 domain-containing protein n=1 Tax=Spirochaeta africana (strain ATCC 700263 / DSM 8902 / Z-7692) TaxID=889378 RepID=H9UFF2_SPIAZ|nr:DUF4867 family protein [Spirochaeta africana]AFG36245.1 hypothetical protein Spiaf_0136 [Spirochaeta africana DSM 8902]